MIFKGSWPSVPLRRCLPYRLPGCSYSTPWHLQEFQNKRQVKSAPDYISTQRRLLWGSSEPPQHFGPKSRIPDLFERKDEIHLKLATQQLEWREAPPQYHHDMLEAVSRVGRIEERIQYTFKNKMLCVEALKVTTLSYPLFFKGMIYKVKPNNRLALLGDRVLSMILCDIWYSTGYSPAHYAKAQHAIESTSKLHYKAHKFSIDREVLIGEGVSTASVRQSAESLEAILGAVYVDSDRNLETVKHVIKSVELDRHEFLKAPPEAHPELQDWDKQCIVYREEEQLFEERIKSLEHKAEELQKHWRDAEPFTIGVPRAKPNISPEAQSALRTEAAKLKIDARQLSKEVDQAPISAVCTQVKETIRKRAKIMIYTALALQSEMDHSDGIIDEQSTEELAIGPRTTDYLDPVNENPPPDESAQDGAPEKTEEQSDSLNCLFLSEESTDGIPKLAISASKKSSAIPADSVLPRDSNPTIIALIDEYNEVIKQHHTSRTRNIGIWSNKEFGLKFVAWKNALQKTRTLERQGEPADTLAMYEDMLQKSLENSLPAERKELAARQNWALLQKAEPAVSLEVEKPTISTLAKEETNLTKEQGQGQKQEKKRLTPAHNRHRKEIKEFSETVEHLGKTVESVEDLERNISEFHTAAWEINNKTAERVPQRLTRRPSYRPQPSTKVGGLVWKTMPPRQGKTSSEAPPRTWSMRKPRKTLVRYQTLPTEYGTSTFPSRPKSRYRANP